jgi:hypothetical protein
MSTPKFSYVTRSKREKQVGICPSYDVTTISIGKQNSAESPYCIANEYICATLAQRIRLPVPPFAIMKRTARSQPMFASLGFLIGQDSRPKDAQAGKLWEMDPFLTTGIVLFDVWIGNPDRSEDNILVDDGKCPKKIVIIDHERALFGARAGYGLTTLKTYKKSFIANGLFDRGSGSILLPAIKKDGHFNEWFDRIEKVDDWFIRSTCEGIREVSVRKRDCDAAANFLIERRNSLRKIVIDNRDRFVGITQWEILF